VIANITGRLRAVEKNALVVELGGIGIRVYVPETLAAKCGPRGSISLGSTLVLHTHLHVREDELTLYGCTAEDDIQLFKLLLSVSGVGPKVGLGMLSTLSADDIRVAIATEKAEVLSSVPGIGTRTAQKIILDLKDKVQVSAELVSSMEGGRGVPPLMEEDEEVLGALTTLGYSVVEAQTALQNVPPDVRGVEERLRAALSYLGT
jgi:Holliday junction DNA helicase RuvA